VFDGGTRMEVTAEDFLIWGELVLILCLIYVVYLLGLLQGFYTMV
jgi:hypothetical protein